MVWGHTHVYGHGGGTCCIMHGFGMGQAQGNISDTWMWYEHTSCVWTCHIMPRCDMETGTQDLSDIQMFEHALCMWTWFEDIPHHAMRAGAQAVAVA